MKTQTSSPLAVHSEEFRIRHSEADRLGELKLAAWFDFLQEAAANHATKLGVGLADLRESHRLWVLSRLRLGISRVPGIGETIRVETYPNGIDRLFAKRQFLIFDATGTEIARASSWWLLLNAEKLRPIKTEFLREILPDNSDRPDCFAPGEKHHFQDREPIFSVPVRYSMEDVNGHMNNAQYAALTQDCLAQLADNSPRRITELEIQFHAAAKAPDMLAVAGKIQGDAFFIQGKNQTGSGIFSAAGRVF